MDKGKLIKELNEVIDKNNLKKSTVEEKLKFPKNGLSNFLTGKKELPDKWIVPIQSYVDCFKEEYKPQPVVLSKVDEGQKENKNIVGTKMVVDKDGFKEKPISAIIKETNDKINKDFGPGTVMFFGDKPDTGYKTVSTGSLQLDMALGIGGLPRGRMVELFGMESSGKTTIALNCIADAQRQGLKCFLVDAENSFDPEYAAALGVNIDTIGYCQPSYGEQGLEVADRQISTGEYGVVVIDSVAALIPKSELEGEMGDSKMGAHARLMSQACRKLVGTVAKTNTLLIFINQIRNKIGVSYGSPEVTTGGMALQFYASVRLSVSRSTTNDNSIMKGDAKLGNLTTVKVIKNKCAPPFKSAKFNIIYGVGIDKDNELIDVAIDLNVIQKNGGWYSYNGSKLGQGRDAVKDVMDVNENFKKEVYDKVLSLIKQH